MPAAPPSARLVPTRPPPKGPAPLTAPVSPTSPPPATPAVAVSDNKAVAAALRAQKHKRPTAVPVALAEGDNSLDAQPVPASSAANAMHVTPPGQRFDAHQKASNKARPGPNRSSTNMFLAYHGGQRNPAPPAFPPVGDPVQHQAFLHTPRKSFQPPLPAQQGRPYQSRVMDLNNPGGSQEFDVPGERELTAKGYENHKGSDNYLQNFVLRLNKHMQWMHCTTPKA